MNRLYKVTSILLLILSLSCAEKKSSEKEISKLEIVSPTKTDTLKFTAGIRAIFQDSKGNYWFGSHKEGVALFNGISFKYFTINDGLPDNQIRSIQEDKNGNIWLGTSNGISMYNGYQFTNYVTETNNLTLEWSATTGNLWFYAGEEDGIYRFDGMNMNYLIFPKPKNDNPNTSYGVTGISKGKDNSVWIATYAALFNFNGKAINVFDAHKLALKKDEVLHIRSVLADSKGRIWIGNNGIGVILKNGDAITNFSKEQGKLIPMDEFEANIKAHQTNKNTGLQSVFAIEEDSEGNIWFGDRDTGAWKYDGKTLTNYTIANKLSTQMIWDIYEDTHKNLLFAMADGGVYQFNGKSFDKRF